MTTSKPTTSGTVPTIKWEDEDSGFGDDAADQTLARTGSTGKDMSTALGEDDDESESGDSSAFAELLRERGDHVEPARLMVGQKVGGTLVTIPEAKSGAAKDAHVDLGGKETGIIDLAELLDEKGELAYKVGDWVDAFVVSRQDGDIVLSRRQLQSLKNLDDLRLAKDQKLAVRGRVARVIKGGFEVTILGRPAFCPISQIDLRSSDDPATHVGKDYEFLVERVDERGRNIVLSRAQLLRVQGEAKLKELVSSLRPDQVFDGTVTEVRDFGAFVDIGGVEGMVHVSELSYARVARPSDVVSRGDKVKVKVLKVEQPQGLTEAGKPARPKISLSMKAAAQDPWDAIHEHVKGGAQYTGRVTKLMPFGAFVELKAGIEGLIHVSEMTWMKRVHHPSEVVKVGDTVTVTVKDVDSANRRIGLTMKQVEDDPWFDVAARFPAGKTVTAPVEKLKGFGALVTLAPGLSGLVPVTVLKKKFGDSFKAHSVPGKSLDVVVAAVEKGERKIRLSLAGVDEDDADRRDYLEYVKAEEAARAKAQAEQSASADDPTRKGSFGALLAAKLGKS
jgi:small subunit ribosomal protein S1